MAIGSDDIVAFWRAAGADRWWKKDAAFDEEILRRFESCRRAAMDGTLDAWSESAQGALALILILDQFGRNMYRGEARAFAGDAQARTAARAAIGRGFDRAFETGLRAFFYLPFMHSEKLEDQEFCVAQFRDLDGAADNLKFALLHRDIIARFGRFPHRNPILGRITTQEEQRFLDDGGFAG